jgi:hypothetical protein
MENLHCTDFFVVLLCSFFIMDLSITQAYTIYQKMSSDSRIQVMSSFNLKKNVCHSLISPWMNVHGRNGGEVNNSATDGVGQDPANNGRVTIASSLGVINRMHGRPGQEILRTLTASCAGR